MEKLLEKEKPVVLFDGECNFCDASVNFILDHNSRKDLYFASLQSDYGQQILKKFHLPAKTFSTLLFVEEGKYYTRSTAALKIASRLDGVWKLLVIFRIIPQFIRDFAYNILARNRYKWFGKKDHCRLPTPEIRSRFLG